MSVFSGFGIGKCITYGLSVVLMIAAAVSNDALYSGGVLGMSVNCGLFEFELCMEGTCFSGDTGCDAFDSTRKAASAMWVMGLIFILIGLGLCLVSVLMKIGSENKHMKYGMIAVDVFASLWLVILLVLVAVQPQGKWCDADFSDLSLSYEYGFYLIILTVALTIAMSAGFCFSVTQSSYTSIENQ